MKKKNPLIINVYGMFNAYSEFILIPKLLQYIPHLEGNLKYDESKINEIKLK